MNCTMEGCENYSGPDALEIHHKGNIVGFICDICQGTAKGLKVFLKKDDDGIFQIGEVTPIAKPL